MHVREAQRTTTPGAARDGGWTHALAVPLAVAALLAVLVAAFAWPAVNTAPRGVDLAVVAPSPVAGQVESQLAANAGEGAFDITVLDDRAAAEQAIRDREVYGALVLGPGGGEALIASAASPAVAQMLTQIANGIPPQAGGPLTVTDVVPLPADDPRGLGLAAGLLPLVVGGFALGVLTSLRVPGRAQRLTALVLGALVAGLTVVGLLQGWLGALDGPYWASAGVAALVILAVAATAAGLYRALGAPGLALAALVVIVLGVPIAGVTSAPEMLPEGWGALGQWLPAGAGATALRSTVFFDGAGAGMAFVVLSVWALLGLALMMLPARAVAAHEAVPTERRAPVGV